MLKSASLLLQIHYVNCVLADSIVLALAFIEPLVEREIGVACKVVEVDALGIAVEGVRSCKC